MAPGTEVISQIGTYESGCNKDAMTPTDDGESDNLSQQNSGKPPRMASAMRHCISTTKLVNEAEAGFSVVISPSSSIEGSQFLPIFRSGSFTDQGPKRSMEDEHICVDNLLDHLSSLENVPLPSAFYGVFDGHNGTDAALFTRKNILKFILEETHFPLAVKKAVRNAFVKADHAFVDSESLDSSSGTTVLTALILGRTILIANAGDSRAVLGKRGRAIELSKDHKPSCTSERLRIEKMGGVVYDGYLNGQLSVARALGDWHLKGPKGSSYPLSCEPELQEMLLAEEDEFLVMGCDGLWDVMTSQCAVTMVRKALMRHNDPTKCCEELVNEALRRNTCDNLTVVVVCFSPDPPPKIEIPRIHKRRSISAEGLDLLKGVYVEDNSSLQNG
ncbi:hypothetical protein V2J09_009816 [Rumex salicifolius]